MKNVNILSIIEAYRKLNNTLFQKLMNSYGIISGIKDYELNGIESFVNELLKIKNSITIVNNYYLGYSIPQIGKEFDLLRFGDNYIINIEIKTESSTRPATHSAIRQNHSYCRYEEGTYGKPHSSHPNSPRAYSSYRSVSAVAYIHGQT